MREDPPPETPRLERWGTRVLVQGAATPAASGDAHVHVLDPAEQAALRRIEVGAVLRATLAGALSALASAITEVVAGAHFALDHAPTMDDLARYWSVFGLVTLIASLLEIAYLYVDTLLAVRALASSAGLSLHVAEDGEAIAGALARAALELPDPDRPVLGVNPRRESSRAMLLAASLAYKAKIGVTSFLLKVLVRRALGRLATRQLLAFAAVPVNAIWNGVVTYRVLREARVRAMGPSAVEAALPSLLDPARPLSPRGRQAVARAIASAMVRTQAAHPNLVYLLRRVLEHVGPFEDEFVLDDTQLFLTQLGELDADERATTLRVLAFASVLDGRLASSERRLLRDAGADLDEVEAMRRAFVRGQAFASVDASQAVTSTSLG